VSTRNIQTKAGRLVGYYVRMAPSGTAGECSDWDWARIGGLANEDVRWNVPPIVAAAVDRRSWSWNGSDGWYGHEGEVGEGRTNYVWLVKKAR
jgi:hypothetical protein